MLGAERFPAEYEAVEGLRYGEAVLRESMRLKPVAPIQVLADRPPHEKDPVSGDSNGYQRPCTRSARSVIWLEKAIANALSQSVLQSSTWREPFQYANYGTPPLPLSRSWKPAND